MFESVIDGLDDAVEHLKARHASASRPGAGPGHLWCFTYPHYVAHGVAYVELPHPRSKSDALRACVRLMAVGLR